MEKCLKEKCDEQKKIKKFDLWDVLILFAVIAILFMEIRIEGQANRTNEAINAFEMKAVNQAEELNYIMQHALDEKEVSKQWKR